MYLGEDKDVVLLPRRFVPNDAEVGDMLKVFVYHDSENRLIATTQEPIGIVGDIVNLKVVSVTNQGAFYGLGPYERPVCSQIETTDGNAGRRVLHRKNIPR